MKKLKVALSLLLAITLTSIMVLPAFAADTDCDCGTAPVIQVRGIGETLYDANGNEIFSTENIINGILPVIPQLAQFLTDTSNTDLFVSAAEAAVKTIFEPVMYNNNAERDGAVSVKCDSRPVEDYMNFDDNLTEEGKLSKALYDELGDDHVYFFTYDWTGDPTEIVADLQDFIKEVRKQSNHDKVSINAESMGGAIMSLYLNTYGYGYIENLVMANSAFNGLEMMGQLFTGYVNIDAEALTYLLSQEILGNAEYAQLVPYIPVLEQIVPLVNNMMQDEATKAKIYDNIFIPVFAYMPSFWCLVPSYSFDAAKDTMFGENTGVLIETREGAGPELLKIIKQVERASKNTDQMVTDMVGYTYTVDIPIFGEQTYVVEPKINFYANVTNYNRYIAPVTPSANWNSDGVIEVYNASGWATAADMGYNLGENYVQAELKDVANYVSPDNVIDASTCQAPDNTWFIKNLGHVKYDANDGTADFYVWLLTTSRSEDKDVHVNAEYPQFMYYDTTIPELMTWEEKAENDAQGGFPSIGLPGLPDLDLEGLKSALEQIMGNIGNIDIMGILSSVIGVVGGVVGTLGDLIMGLLGGGSGDETPEPTPTPTPDNSGDTTPEAPSTDTPSTDNTPTQTPSHVGSSTVDRTNTQTSGIILSGEPIFSSGADAWIILFVIAAIIAGILIIKL